MELPRLADERLRYAGSSACPFRAGSTCRTQTAENLSFRFDYQINDKHDVGASWVSIDFEDRISAPQYEYTLEDPVYLTEPVKLSPTFALDPGYPWQEEYGCDPEASSRHIVE